jgi:putative nucleotidyltransferase with HDIG domain
MMTMPLTSAHVKTRHDAWMLLTRHTKNKNLLKHALAVEAAMRYYARHFQEDEELWGIVGLLHDFDYEQYPSLDDHPYQGQKILEQEGYSEVVRRGIMAHAPHTGTPRTTLLEKAIFAVDELSGFLVAVALVQPNKKLLEVTLKSVQKKLKQKSFAAAIKREDILHGAQELELSLEEHISHVLSAVQSIAAELGL